MTRMLIVVVSMVWALNGAGAAEWGWQARFTPESSEKLIDHHREIYASAALGDARGVPVRDVVWRAEAFDVHMIDGVIYLEPEIDGDSVGAFFTGRAEVSFHPEGRKARTNVAFHFGAAGLEKEPVGFVYFFTLKGDSLLEQLGVDSEPSVESGTLDTYQVSKNALRQLGTQLTHDFLNRHGLCKGAAYALFAPESIRTRGSEQAYLLYSFNPGRDPEVELAGFGHSEMVGPRARHLLDRYPTYKYSFWGLASSRTEPRRFVPQGEVDAYRNDLELWGKDAKEVSSITFTPAEGLTALRLALTPRLQVTSVTAPDGRALPFMQWKFLADQPNRDPHLVIFTGDSLTPGQPQTLTVTAKGPLLEGVLGFYYLPEEDVWHPRLNDRGAAIFELTASVPKNHELVGAGELVSDETVDNRRRYHFRTTRPHKRSTFYYGIYQTKETEADDTNVKLFASRSTNNTDLKYSATEISNMVKVYNRILGPLEMDHLRVVGIPVPHGRGFEGLILLSERAGFGSMSHGSDVFRAHEVAHQWWGNMVQPKNWPEDRWISESFAEYCAMEYLWLRWEKVGKVREWMRNRWRVPMVRSEKQTTETLTGEMDKVRGSELYAIIDGSGNVYTKGPLVLHMLRYLFEIQKKSDEGFWTLLQDFLSENRYQLVGTQDFIRMTEQHMQARMDWFWDQWIYGTEIPEVAWSYNVRPNEDGGFMLTVEAEQKDTEFVLAIPIYVHLRGGKTLKTPLILRGKEGRAQARLREKPANVTLNDNFESLVSLKKR